MIQEELRRTGIEVIGDAPWGTHFCQFYQTREDLLDILIPYFKAGLENNEFCMWITAEPLNKAEARRAIAGAVPGFDRYLAKGQIEIIPYTEWYLKGGHFDSKRVLNGWVKKLEKALAAGYAGLRLTGNTFWLERKDWRGFTDYEAAVNGVIGRYRILALCTYCMDKCNASEIIDVMRNHEFALVKQVGKWELIESSTYRKAKEELKASEEKYRQLIENLQEGVWVIDKDAHTTFVSPHMAELLGYTVDEMLGKHLFSFMDERGVENARQKLERRKQGIRERHDFELKRKDGTPVYTMIMTEPLTDGEGNYSGAIASIVDITERVKAEVRLKQAVAEWRATFDSITDLVSIHDTDFKLVRANEAFARTLNAEEKKLIGKPCYEIIHHTHKPISCCPHVKTIETKNPTTAQFFEPLLGIYLEVTTSPIFDEAGNITGSVHVARDITERKQAEDALRETRDYLENLINYANAPIIVWDPEFRITRFNHAFERLTGLKAEDVLGKKLDILFPDDSREESLTHIRRAIAGERWEVVEIPILRNDRTVHTVLWNSATLFAADGKTVVATIAQGQDITERKKVEQALQQSQYDLKRAQAVAKTGSWHLDVQRNELVWSEETYRIFGIPQGTPLTYEKFLATVFPDDRDYVDSSWQKALHGEPYDIEHRIIVEGRVKWVREKAELEINREMAIIGGFGTVQDITESKQVEQALRETRDYLENLINYANAPIIVWDPEFRITRFNHAFERLTGLKAEGVLGRKLDILFPDDSREESLAHIRRAVAGERWEVVEIPILRNDGTIHTVLWNSATLFAADGKTVVATIAQGQDITERKQAEDALRETRDYLENLINYANAPIIVWDPEFCITRFNHAFERLTGLKAENVLNKELDILFPPDSREESLAHIRRAVAGERWEVVEIPILRNDGTVRTVLWNSATLYATDGTTVVATIAQGQDITERKQAEEALKRRTDELARSNRDLEQFAYMASHDLQEPLRMVSSYVQLLASRYKGKLDQDADDFIQYASDGVVRMKQLINDLLTYSRVGTRGGNFEEINLEIVLRQALGNLEIKIKDSDAVISHDPLPVVYGDRVQLAQVFQNLLDNAIKFKSNEAPRIHVSAELKGGECICSVRDNGIGIAPEHWDRVFMLFQRLHSRKRYPGTGIGLAICNRIVERHGGKIWVDSKPGEGSTFYFIVPTKARKE